MEKKKVFVIMPFEDKFFEIYEMLKRQFEEDFLFSHAGEEDNQQNILKDIVQAIYDADSFVRKEAKKVAKYIETFSSKLRLYNQSYIELWTKIEKDTLGLLENKFASNNTQDLIAYLKSLKRMQKAIDESCSSVETMKKTSLNNIGMERTLNQAIRFLDGDLDNYITIMGQIVSSIDRILEKSRFIVGNIDSNEV